MNITKLLSMGAAGACGGIAALYLFMVYGTRHVPNGGMDSIGWQMFVIAAAVPVTLFILWHLDFARQLQKGPQSLEP